MFNANHYAVTIKAIGAVESDGKYDAINYNDPITIGIAQWYGTRAAAMLSEIREKNPTAWRGVAASLVSDLETYSTTNAWWTSRYLTTAEGNSIKPVLLASKDIQDARLRADIDDYLAAGKRWGLDVDAVPNSAAFFCTMYHQSPLQARNVVESLTSTPTLEQIYRAALNNNILGRYKTRQDTVYRIIKAGVSADEAEPSPNPGTGPSPNPGTVPLPDQEIVVEGEGIREIFKRGNDLYIRTSNGGNILAYSTGNDMWLPRKNSLGGGTVIIPGDPGDIPAPTDPGTDPGDPGTDPGNPDPEPTPGKWHNPLDIERCTNRFGKLSYTNFHSGIDMGAKQRGVIGDPIYAVYDGKIVRTGKHQQVLYLNSGRGIILDCGVHGGDRMYVYYGHLSSIKFAQGQTVKAGQKIAEMGGTGANDINTDFPVHLHIVVFMNPPNGINPTGYTTVPISNFLDPEAYFKSKGLLKNMNTCPYN